MGVPDDGLAFGQPLADFLTKFATCTRAEFMESQGGVPLLIVTMINEDETQDIVNFETQNLPANIESSELSGDELVEKLNDILPNVKVLNVSKLNNQFKSIVTLGRAPKSDILVNLASISKFHCYFTHNGREKSWFLSDANAQNGTYLDGQRLATNVKAKLQSGSAIRLGMSLSARFFEPEAFYEYIEALSNSLKLA